MKAKLSAILFLLSSVLLFSCNDNIDSPPTASRNKLNARIDGIDWAAETVKATIQDGVMTITGTTSDGKTIELTIYTEVTGSYPLGKTNVNYASYILKTGNTPYSTTTNNTQTEGLVRITKIDREKRTITGTFSFVAFNTIGDIVTINSGELNEIPYTGNTSSNGVLTAKIRGQYWSASSASIVIKNGYITIKGVKGPENITIKNFGYYNSTTYPINRFTGKGYALYRTADTLFSTEYGGNGGAFIITEFDTVKMKMSGTFAFEALDSASNKLNYIASGVFSEVPVSVENDPFNFLNCTMNGKKYTAQYVYGTRSVPTILFTGFSGKELIQFEVPDNIQTGNYNVDQIGSYRIYYTPDNTAPFPKFYYADKGYIVISKHDPATKLLGGSFGFTAFASPTDSIVGTSGTFSVTYGF